jgi:hypothetical protein
MESLMASTVRLYVDASYAVAVMALMGIVSGLAAAGFTGDRARALQVALGMFALTGVFLTVRLWRITRKGTHPPVADPAP